MGMSDHIHATITARAQALGLTAVDLQRACADAAPEGAAVPDYITIRRFLDGKNALNSRYVSLLCEVLGLELKPRKGKTSQRPDAVR